MGVISKVSAILIVVFLIVGVAAGYFAGSLTAPVTTITKTETKTITLTATPTSTIPPATTPTTKPTPTTPVEMLIDLAKKEGKVTIYTSFALDEMKKICVKFEEKYGITVEIVRAPSTEIAEKFEVEQKAGVHQADLIFLALPSIYPKWKEEGYFMKYESPRYDELEEWQYDKYYYAVARYLVHLGSYNKIVFPEGGNITTFKEAVYEACRKIPGKVATTNPAVFGTVAQFWTGVRLALGDAKFKEIAKMLLDAGIKIYDSSATISADLDRGEIGIHLCQNTYRFYESFKAGAPVEVIAYTDVGICPGPTPIAIVKTAPHPNAAKLFFDWFLSREGQEQLVDVTGAYAARRDVHPPEGFKPLNQYKIMEFGVRVSDFALLDKEIQKTLDILREVGWRI